MWWTGRALDWLQSIKQVWWHALITALWSENTPSDTQHYQEGKSDTNIFRYVQCLGWSSSNLTRQSTSPLLQYNLHVSRTRPHSISLIHRQLPRPLPYPGIRNDGPCVGVWVFPLLSPKCPVPSHIDLTHLEEEYNTLDIKILYIILFHAWSLNSLIKRFLKSKLFRSARPWLKEATAIVNTRTELHI